MAKQTHGSERQWYAVHTYSGYEDAVAFNAAVFEWTTTTMSDTPEFRYTVLRHGEDMLAGIMDGSGFLPEGAPARWAVYFGTGDTDASLATITRLGGSVIEAKSLAVGL